MKSIIQNDKRCYFCGCTHNLEEHHCFNGNADRPKSEEYGLKIWVCRLHHTESRNSIHRNAETQKTIKQMAQKKAMEYYNWNEDEFRQVFGKNYL